MQLSEANHSAAVGRLVTPETEVVNATLISLTDDDLAWIGNASTPFCNNAYCVSDDDYLALIHDYVFPTAFEWVMTTLYVIVFVVGLTGNALVCYVVWRNAHMRTVTNLFIVNLSVADLLVIIVCLPPTALVDITETWYFGVAMCKIVHYIQVSCSSVCLLVCSFEFFSFFISLAQGAPTVDNSLRRLYML